MLVREPERDLIFLEVILFRKWKYSCGDVLHLQNREVGSRATLLTGKVDSCTHKIYNPPMEEHFVGKVAQKVVIERGGKILVSLGVGDTNYDLPGGRLNAGEDPKEALKRELYEELGVEIEVGDAFSMETYIKPQSGEPHLYLAYRGRLQDAGATFILAEGEVAEVRWVGREELASLPIWEQDARSIQKYFE